MNLSPNFTLAEFTRSSTALRLNRPIFAPDNIVANLRDLCMGVLEPIREHVKRRIRVNSGYRPPWLNQHVGGSRTSDHMFGCAADLEAEGMTAEEFATEILLILPALPIKQLILEYPPDGWVHVSIPLANMEPKREVLTAVRRGTATVYLRGLSNWRKSA